VETGFDVVRVYDGYVVESQANTVVPPASILTGRMVDQQPFTVYAYVTIHVIVWSRVATGGASCGAQEQWCHVDSLRL
jgi:hypothetical protein